MSSPTKFGSFSLLINFISFISFDFNYFNLSLNKIHCNQPAGITYQDSLATKIIIHYLQENETNTRKSTILIYNLIYFNLTFFLTLRSFNCNRKSINTPSSIKLFSFIYFNSVRKPQC